MNQSEKTRNVHQGRNVKRLREMQGIKQEAFAYELGDKWTQKKVSQLESQETIEIEVLEQVSKILRVTPETIQKLGEDSAVNIISNTFTDFKDNSAGINYNCDITFNPIDKLVTAYEDNIKLYERLLQSEKDKNELLKAKG